MNRHMLIVLVVLLNLMAWTAIREVNHALAPHRIYLHLEVLLVLLPAFYFRTSTGALLMAATALLIASARPVPLEVSLFGVFGLWGAGLWVRRRMRRENARHLAAFAAGAQICVLLALALVLWPGDPVPADLYAQRLAGDALVSAGAAALLAGPWSRFQVRFLGALGWNLDSEGDKD